MKEKREQGPSPRELVLEAIKIVGGEGQSFNSLDIASITELPQQKVRDILAVLGGVVDNVGQRGNGVYKLVDDSQEGPMWNTAGTSGGIKPKSIASSEDQQPVKSRSGKVLSRKSQGGTHDH